MCRRKKDVRKIYMTTDGYLSARPDIKKHRRVAAIDQRRDDGALAVVKIYSKKGKDGKNYIEKLVLTKNAHPLAIKKDSIVGRNVIIGTQEKTPDGKVIYKPIFERDMDYTGDKLTREELNIIKKEAGGSTRKYRKTHKKKMKKWHKHFRK